MPQPKRTLCVAVRSLTMAEVWGNACPSVWNIQCGSQSSNSTPLGSPVAPRTPTMVSGEDDSRGVMLDLSQRQSTSTFWSTIQREAAGGFGSTSAEVEHAYATDQSHSLPDIVSDQGERKKTQSEDNAQARSPSQYLYLSEREKIPLQLPSVRVELQDNAQPRERTQSLDVPLLLAELAVCNSLAKFPHPAPLVELSGAP
ncbi:hypothetical protein IQ06DRAFT_310707 [Phaeosphaeriaceae sp. SRC1lsM3a]|nr:hypothetical protein IQ06DRAFT_310707 [Stagonospora sp. SRC1lsM3a]